MIEWATRWLGWTFEPPPAAEENKTTAVMEKVLKAKQAHVDAALKDKWQRYNPILIGGDLFTSGFLAFEGAKYFAPSIQQIAAVGVATLVCGVAGGAINIGVGAVSLKESIQAFRNGDKVLGLRLALDFVCCTAIGAIMILASLALQVSVLGGIGAFFAANPWFLPVLFFAITIPLLLELSYRLKNVQTAADLGSKLKLNELEPLLNEKEPDWKKIEELYRDTPFDIKSLDPGRLETFSQKMEELQADMGVTAGIEVFALLKCLQEHKREEALKQLQAARKRIKEWNNSLKLRMLQQFLFIVGFGVSMGALAPTGCGNLLNGIQSSFVAAANVIPLYMDTFWPFKRNTPIVVPKVEL